jgi:two-component system NarL family sensor kinase
VSNHRDRSIEGVVIDVTERKESERLTAEFSRQVIQAQETERQRVSRELHDGVNQLLSSVKHRLENIDVRASARNRPLLTKLHVAKSVLQDAMNEVRRISRNLRPGVLDHLGIKAAVRNLCDELASHTGVKIEFILRGMARRLPSEIEIVIFRIVQEALHNIEKHSEAKKVELAIKRKPSRVSVSIRDDGRGIIKQESDAKRNGGLGLVGMRERIRQVGGTFRIESNAGKGTIIYAEIPLKKAEDQKS